MQNQEIHIFTLNKIYFTSSNCIFIQLQGIVFIQLQGNDILVNCQGNKFIQGTYIYSQNVKSFEAIVFFHGIIFISRNLSAHSRKYILVQGKYIHSGRLYPFKEIYSSKEHIFVQVQGHMLIQGNYIHSRTLRSRT